MRLAAQAKMGFYPAHEVAIRGIASHLALNDKRPTEVNIIDPCAGEGTAIALLADLLEVDLDRAYAIELDGARAALCKGKLPNTLGPCGFLGSRITGQSFGLAYVNPPFDSELGGGRREEQAFAERATRLLVTHGVLALVVPLGALNGNRPFCQFLDSRYEDIRILAFPKAHRPYNEILVLARKRKVDIPMEAVHQHGTLHKMEFPYRTYADWFDILPEVGTTTYRPIINGRPFGDETMPTYEIPWAWKPNTFAKVAFTEGELNEVLESSPLNALLKDIAVPPPARPPLPLDKGHVALLLASGMLNGVVEGVDGPHVVRGTANKVEYISERSSTENADSGAVTEKVVFSQKIVLTIRAVGANGSIQTFSDVPPADVEADAADTHEGRYDEDAA